MDPQDVLADPSPPARVPDPPEGPRPATAAAGTTCRVLLDHRQVQAVRRLCLALGEPEFDAWAARLAQMERDGPTADTDADAPASWCLVTGWAESPSPGAGRGAHPMPGRAPSGSWGLEAGLEAAAERPSAPVEAPASQRTAPG